LIDAAVFGIVELSKEKEAYSNSLDKSVGCNIEQYPRFQVVTDQRNVLPATDVEHIIQRD
jgi:hypothetical protein